MEAARDKGGNGRQTRRRESRRRQETQQWKRVGGRGSGRHEEEVAGDRGSKERELVEEGGSGMRAERRRREMEEGAGQRKRRGREVAGDKGNGREIWRKREEAVGDRGGGGRQRRWQETQARVVKRGCRVGGRHAIVIVGRGSL
eukprot:SAG11_NODE_1991_length_3957_cov_2.906169_3_plen_144_part_00